MRKQIKEAYLSIDLITKDNEKIDNSIRLNLKEGETLDDFFERLKLVVEVQLGWLDSRNSN
jgi:hypothetical protein